MNIIFISSRSDFLIGQAMVNQKLNFPLRFVMSVLDSRLYVISAVNDETNGAVVSQTSVRENGLLTPC